MGDQYVELGAHLCDPGREALESLHRFPEGLVVFPDQGALSAESLAKGVHVRWVYFGQIVLLWGSDSYWTQEQNTGRTGVGMKVNRFFWC